MFGVGVGSQGTVVSLIIESGTWEHNFALAPYQARDLAAALTVAANTVSDTTEEDV